MKPRWQVALMLIALPILIPYHVIAEGFRAIRPDLHDIPEAIRYAITGK